MAKHVCKIPDPPVDTTRWMGTYGDMVTLLMAFFVMLFAVSDTNATKFEAFVSGLAGPFNNQSLSIGLLDGADADIGISPITLIAPGSGRDMSNPEDTDDPAHADLIELVTSARTAAAAAQLSEVEGDLEAALAASSVPISVDVRDDQRGLVVTISTDDVLFDVGSAALSEDGRRLIAEVAPVIVDAPNTVIVEGHTDDQPLNDGGYTNWNLSTDRAVAVVQLLGGSFGLPYDRISAAGYGEYRPLVPNTSAEARAQNRRVEILLVGLDVAVDRDPAPPPAQVVTPPNAGEVAAIDPQDGFSGPDVLDFSETLPRGTTPIASILGR